MPKSEKVFYFLLFCFSLLVGLGQLYLFRDYMVDDSFITLRYVKNALEGHGLVCNTGERVEGFTSPLHILLLCALGYFGLDLVVASKLLGILSYIVIIAIISISCFRSKNHPSVNLPSGVIVISLVATSFALTFFAMTGMETAIFSLMTLLVFFEAAKGKVTIKLILLIFLSFLCRPEGITFLFWILLSFFILRCSECSGDANTRMVSKLGKGEIFAIAILLLLVTPLLFARWTYYGEILPNTFFAKAPWTTDSGMTHWSLKGLGSITSFFSSAGGVLGILLFLAALLKRDKWFTLLLTVSSVTVSLLCFQKYSGGDWMVGSRYLVPVLAVWAVGLGISMTSLNIMEVTVAPIYRCFITGVLVMAICISNISETRHFLGNIQKYPNNTQTSIGLKDIGTWIRDNLPSTFRVRNWRIGAIGYYCDNPIIDTWGLVSRDIGRLRFESSSEPHGNKLVFKRVEELNPEAIITLIQPGKPADEEGYVLVHEGRSGDQHLGVWVRTDLMERVKNRTN